MSQQKRTEIATLGKVAFVKQLTQTVVTQSQTLVKGVGDDAAVIRRGDSLELISSETMLEGIDFDLRYTPLEHLGYKLIVAAVSNIYAMNGTPEYVTISLGLSTRFSVEEAEALYSGLNEGCRAYSVALIGGNTSSSRTGLTLAATAIGSVEPNKITYRNGASDTDLLCVSGSLGGAYMGVKLLERETLAVGSSGISPKLEGYQYILSRQLKPQARRDIIEQLDEYDLVPTAMIDITSGLASATMHLCEASQVGARVYLDRLPINSELFKVSEEMGIDPVVAALNGGDDFELLFTVPLSRHKEVLSMPGVDVIGHIVPASKGAALTTPDGQEIRMQSPDWTATQQ